MVAAQLLWVIFINYLIKVELKALPFNNILTTRNPLDAIPCNFENGGLCPGYESDKTSKAQWYVQQGATSSAFTGPSYDHTLGQNGNGFYVYMESSNQLNGRVATLQTKILDNRRTQGKKLCLSFFYHMYGHTMGELSVHVTIPSDKTSTNYFTLKRNQKVNAWQQGTFAFDTPNKPFKVVFKGKTSFSYFGDIGLDDINIKEVAVGKTCDFWPTKASPSNHIVIPVPPPTGNSVSNKQKQDCGKRQFAIGYITGGSKVKILGKYPWMAMLLQKTKEGTFEQTCGGTLIHPEWVLTAAHCVETVMKNDFLRVRLSTLSRTKIGGSTQELSMKDIYVHPQYNTDTKFNNDIALLRLNRPSVLNTFVQPICMPKDETPSGTRCVIAGWGKLWAEPLNDTSYPTDLMEALIEVKSSQKCKEKYKGLITKNMLCAGMFDTTYTDTCFRDSGGPLMCENNDGSWSLTGITSWGNSDGCGQMDHFGMYTKMTELQSWVNWQQANPDKNKMLF